MKLSEKSKVAKQELRKTTNGSTTVQTSKIIAVDEGGECLILKNKNQVMGSSEYDVFEVRYRNGKVTSELL